MSSISDIGAAVKRNRKRYNLTQQQLGDLVGLSDKTIRDIEKGTGSPSLSSVFAAMGSPRGHNQGGGLVDLESLKRVNRADVYKGEELAGTLARLDDGSGEFAYLADYLGPDIAFSLPKASGRMVTQHGAVPEFFAGLLPEGHRLGVLQRAIKTSLDDELSLLLAIGGDTPGDVRIVPSGQESPRISPAVDISDGDMDFAAVTHLVDLVGIPGVQSKASASMVNSPVRFGSEEAILKIDPPEHPHLVENEALHLGHARGLGIPVSNCVVVEDSYGIKGLVVARFDRTEGQRLALEDATQIMGLPPSAKYSLDTAEVIMAMKDRATAPVVAARNLYLQFLFAWLNGNGDLHAKKCIPASRSPWHVDSIPCV